MGLARINLCLPGACMTAFVPDDADDRELGRATDTIARKYETTTGRELDADERAALRRRLEEGLND